MLPLLGYSCQAFCQWWKTNYHQRRDATARELVRRARGAVLFTKAPWVMHTALSSIQRMDDRLWGILLQGRPRCAWLCPAQLAPLLVLYLRWTAILFLSVLHFQTLKHWQSPWYSSIYREGLFSKHCVKFLARVAPIPSYQVPFSVLVMKLCHMTRSHCPQCGGPQTQVLHTAWGSVCGYHLLKWQLER